MTRASPREVWLTAAAAVDPWTLEPAAGAARPIDEVRAEIEAASGVVVLIGHDPLSLPHLPELLAACRARRVAPALQLLARPGDQARLAGLDVELLRLGLHGDPHDRHTGQPGSRAEVLALLTARRPRVRLITRVDGPGWPSALRDGRDRAEEITLVGAPDRPHADRAAIVGRAWRLLRGSATGLVLEGLDGAPPASPPVPAARRLDPQLVELRAQGGWPEGFAPVGRSSPLRSGLRLAPPQARADLPPLDGPTVLVAPGLGDVLLATSTLPALARRLGQLGVPLRFDSVWEPPWNLHSGDEPVRAAARMATARRFDRPFLDHLDLSGAAHVLVPGWEAAADVVHRLPARATLHVFDLHMLVGVDRLLARWPAADWRGRLVVHSCFPGFAGMYLRAGVPIEAVVWRPYPIDTATFSPGAGGGPIVCAGSHLRAHHLLTGALDRLGTAAPTVEHYSSSPAAHARVVPRGVVGLHALFAALQAASFVILPVGWSTTHAAGQSAAMLARAAGRAILGTRVWGLVDHLREGADALLVPPDDAGALAEGIDRLANDPALRAALSRPDCPGIETWAHGLATGSAPAWPA